MIQTKRQNKLEEIGEGGSYANGYSLYFSYSLPKSLHELQRIYRKVAITACTIQCNMPCTTCHGFREIVLDNVSAEPTESFAAIRLSFADDRFLSNKLSGRFIRQRHVYVVREKKSNTSPDGRTDQRL